MFSQIASAGCDASVAKLLKPLELGGHRRTGVEKENNVRLGKDMRKTPAQLPLVEGDASNCRQVFPDS